MRCRRTESGETNHWSQTSFSRCENCMLVKSCGETITCYPVLGAAPYHLLLEILTGHPPPLPLALGRSPRCWAKRKTTDHTWRARWQSSPEMLVSLRCSYRFVVIFLPLMNLVEVETDLKLPIPPPPKDEELKEVIPPPPMSPNVLKPGKTN